MKRGHSIACTTSHAAQQQRDSGHWSVLGGLGIGAAIMYFLDPDRGRRRRALLRDQFVHAGRRLREARRITAVDIANRSSGLWVETSRWFREHSAASDRELVERVRSKLGRVVSHPHAIDVSVRDGHVTLSGPILMEEVHPLISCVAKADGVRSVEDRLSAYAEAGRVSALQGGRLRANRFELFQRNWSPAARVLVGTVGAGLMLGGMRARGAQCVALEALGSALLLRAATNRELTALIGVGDVSGGVTVQKTINVNAPVDRVFAFWRDYQNFPRFMTNVRDVQPIDEACSRWIVAGPAGVPIEWVSRLMQVVPNERIEWRSEPGSPVRHGGVVRFYSNGNGGTRVDVQLAYVPPAGAIGHAVAKVFGADPKSEMDADLMRMKTMIETGHRPHDAAWPATSVTTAASASEAERAFAAGHPGSK